MRQKEFYKLFLILPILYSIGCASSNSQNVSYGQRLAPAKYTSPLPVEIAKDIESITEDGVLMMNPDPLTSQGLSAISAKLNELENKVSLAERIQILEQRTVSYVPANQAARQPASSTVARRAPKKPFLRKGGGPLMQKHSSRQLGALGKPAKLSKTTAQVVIYTVKWGDTLMKIAFDKFGNYLKWRDIYNVNKDKMKSPRKMQVGTELVIENVKYVYIKKDGKPYLIRKEDTLRSISKKLYGTEDRWAEIWKNNPQLIRNPKKIYAGFTLYAPDTKEIQLLRVPANNDSEKTK